MLSIAWSRVCLSTPRSKMMAPCGICPQRYLGTMHMVPLAGLNWLAYIFKLIVIWSMGLVVQTLVRKYGSFPNYKVSLCTMFAALSSLLLTQPCMTPLHCT